jgi:hypothetical protein
MKKITFSVALIALALYQPLKAQITITSADMPAIGDKIVMATDSTPTVTAGGNGANQTWAMSALKTQKVDNMVGMTPAATNYSKYFGPATVAYSHTSSLENFSFYNITATAMDYSGTVLTRNSVTEENVFAPQDQELPLPATYNAKWSVIYRAYDKIVANGFPGYDSSMATVYGIPHDTIDAWGTITTPLGTYNCIRQRDVSIIYDSIYYHSTSSNTWVSLFNIGTPAKFYAYIWYANTLHQPIVELITDSTGKTVSSATWLKSQVTGIEEINSNSTTILFPNPVTTRLTMQVTSPDTRFVKIFDITGRELITATTDNNMAFINTSAFPAGMYLYVTTDKIGNVTDRGKFTVSK